MSNARCATHASAPCTWAVRLLHEQQTDEAGFQTGVHGTATNTAASDSRPFSEPVSHVTDRDALLRLLVERAFRYSDEPVFRLASGALSRYYLDCKLVTLDPKGATLVGRLVFERLKGLDVRAVGGLTLGADPISLATAIASEAAGAPIAAFIVRKEPKGHGTGQWIEGPLPAGAPVAVVDDVVTTGGSTEKALDILQKLGHPVRKVVALVDRGEGGREAISRRGVPFESLYHINDFLTMRNADPPRTV